MPPSARRAPTTAPTSPGEQVLQVAAEAGYPTVLGFDVDPLDYDDPGADVVVERTLASVAAGSIVSLHFGHAGTVDALPAILDGIEQQEPRRRHRVRRCSADRVERLVGSVIRTNNAGRIASRRTRMERTTIEGIDLNDPERFVRLEHHEMFTPAPGRGPRALAGRRASRAAATGTS